eukprot:NODE_128_length_17019_cov_0.764480.p5 type:complete len:407 gc:universal NODE_128_length_17019_cov_0.764480:13065-14285(+)
MDQVYNSVLNNEFDMTKFYLDKKFGSGISFRYENTKNIQIEHQAWLKFVSKNMNEIEYDGQMIQTIAIKSDWTALLLSTNLKTNLLSKETNAKVEYSTYMVANKKYQLATKITIADSSFQNYRFENVWINSNQIQLEIQGIKYLTFLDLSNQLVSTIPISDFKHLQILLLSGNKFDKIPIIPSLVLLDIANNKIDNVKELFKVTFLRKLKSLDIRFNLVSARAVFLKAILPNLKFVNNCSVGNKELNLTTLSEDITHALLPLTFESVNSLVLPFNKIKEVDFNFSYAFPNLIDLNLSNNSISDVSFLSNCEKLKCLDLSCNSIINFEIILQGIEKLNLAHNQIREMAALVQPSLKRLDLHHNHIARLQINGILASLRYLNISKNRISHIQPKILSKLPNLEELLIK